MSGAGPSQEPFNPAKLGADAQVAVDIVLMNGLGGKTSHDEAAKWCGKAGDFSWLKAPDFGGMHANSISGGDGLPGH